MPAAASGEKIDVLTPGPEGKELPVSIQADIEETRWVFDKTEQSGSGVYLASLGSSPSETIPFAVNVNTDGGRPNSESNLVKADPDEIPEGFTVQTTWQNLDAEPASEISRRSGLQHWLLIGALLLALVEMILAWHFSRGTA